VQSILSANGYHFLFLSGLSHSSAQIVSQLLEKSHRTQEYWDWGKFGHHEAIIGVISLFLVNPTLARSHELFIP